MKKIAVLTSGGDAPGMNAAIRAVVRTGLKYDLEVFGISHGYRGLLEGDMRKMDAFSVSGIIDRGGTILYSALCPEFKYSENCDKAVQILRDVGIEGLVIIGGDGSFRGATELSKRGINVCLIPSTIDNDIPSTDYSIGFDTALNTALNVIMKLRDTSSSHNRVNVVEVTGRLSGHLALCSAICGGAEAVILPEVPYDLDEICVRLIKGKDRRHLHSIVVLPEGVGEEQFSYISREIEKRTAMEMKTTHLGHIQRGGHPTAFDILLSSKMGALAVERLVEGLTNRVMCYKNGKYVDMDIYDALAMPNELDKEALRIYDLLTV